eukprot:8018895-Pyramimonas_sp.AAC.1
MGAASGETPPTAPASRKYLTEIRFEPHPASTMNLIGPRRKALDFCPLVTFRLFLADTAAT